MKPSVNILILLFFLISACSETVDSEYSTLDIAKKENAIRTGLIPEWLPDTSRQIKVAFDISTNEKILAFQYKMNEGWNLLGICEEIDAFDPPKPQLNRDWWPEDVPANRASPPRHTFYKCENGGSFLAVHPKIGKVFYWNTKYS
jgi:hypothetical protein